MLLKAHEIESPFPQHNSISFRVNSDLKSLTDCDKISEIQTGAAKRVDGICFDCFFTRNYCTNFDASAINALHIYINKRHIEK